MLLDHVGKVTQWYVCLLISIGRVVIIVGIVRISIIGVVGGTVIVVIIVIVIPLRALIGKMCCTITNKAASPSIVIVVPPAVIVIIAIVGVIIVVRIPTPAVACNMSNPSTNVTGMCFPLVTIGIVIVVIVVITPPICLRSNQLLESLG